MFTDKPGFLSAAVKVTRADRGIAMHAPSRLRTRMQLDRGRKRLRLRLKNWERQLQRELLLSRNQTQPPPAAAATALGTVATRQIAVATAADPLLALGIMCKQNERDRRAYARRSLAHGVVESSGAFLYRFVVDLQQTQKGSLQLLQLEDAAHSDIARLTAAGDGSRRHKSATTFHWFMLAASLFPAATFVGKTDLDAFVVVPRAILLLSMAAAEGRAAPTLLGVDGWASLERPAMEICAGPRAAPGKRTKHATARSCHTNASTDGPFACGFDSALILSQPLMRWLASSEWVAAEVTPAFTAGSFGPVARHAAGAFMGWIVSKAPGLRVLRLPKHAVHDINQPVADEICLAKLRLKRDLLSTGHFHVGGGHAPEVVWPQAIVVCQVLAERQWNRTWAMAAHWTRALGKAPELANCLRPKSSVGD